MSRSRSSKPRSKPNKPNRLVCIFLLVITLTSNFSYALTPAMAAFELFGKNKNEFENFDDLYAAIGNMSDKETMEFLNSSLVFCSKNPEVAFYDGNETAYKFSCLVAAKKDLDFALEFDTNTTNNVKNKVRFLGFVSTDSSAIKFNGYGASQLRFSMQQGSKGFPRNLFNIFIIALYPLTLRARTSEAKILYSDTVEGFNNQIEMLHGVEATSLLESSFEKITGYKPALLHQLTGLQLADSASQGILNTLTQQNLLALEAGQEITKGGLVISLKQGNFFIDGKNTGAGISVSLVSTGVPAEKIAESEALALSPALTATPALTETKPAVQVQQKGLFEQLNDWFKSVFGGKRVEYVEWTDFQKYFLREYLDLTYSSSIYDLETGLDISIFEDGIIAKDPNGNVIYHTGPLSKEHIVNNLPPVFETNVVDGKTYAKFSSSALQKYLYRGNAGPSIKEGIDMLELFKTYIEQDGIGRLRSEAEYYLPEKGFPPSEYGISVSRLPETLITRSPFVPRFVTKDGSLFLINSEVLKKLPNVENPVSIEDADWKNEVFFTDKIPFSEVDFILVSAQSKEKILSSLAADQKIVEKYGKDLVIFGNKPLKDVLVAMDWNDYTLYSSSMMKILELNGAIVIDSETENIKSPKTEIGIVAVPETVPVATEQPKSLLTSIQEWFSKFVGDTSGMLFPRGIITIMQEKPISGIGVLSPEAIEEETLRKAFGSIDIGKTKISERTEFKDGRLGLKTVAEVPLVVVDSNGVPMGYLSSVFDAKEHLAKITSMYILPEYKNSRVEEALLKEWLNNKNLIDNLKDFNTITVESITSSYFRKVLLDWGFIPSSVLLDFNSVSYSRLVTDYEKQLGKILTVEGLKRDGKLWDLMGKLFDEPNRFFNVIWIAQEFKKPILLDADVLQQAFKLGFDERLKEIAESPKLYELWRKEFETQKASGMYSGPMRDIFLCKSWYETFVEWGVIIQANEGIISEQIKVKYEFTNDFNAFLEKLEKATTVSELSNIPTQLDTLSVELFRLNTGDFLKLNSELQRIIRTTSTLVKEKNSWKVIGLYSESLSPDDTKVIKSIADEAKVFLKTEILDQVKSASSFEEARQAAKGYGMGLTGEQFTAMQYWADAEIKIVAKELAGGATWEKSFIKAKIMGGVAASPETKNIIAIGDIHGQYDNFVKILKDAKLIDSNLNWVGGSTNLVITGDILDRGPNAKAVMDLLMKLEQQAPDKINVLLGNHELLIFKEDYRYVGSTNNGFNSYQEMAYALSENGKYGKWLGEKPIVLKIDDVIFSHAGINPEFSKYSLGQLNEMARQAIENKNWGAGIFKAGAGRGGTGIGGPLWMDFDSEMKQLSESQIDAILARYEAKMMVVGHTPNQNGLIEELYGGKVVKIDVGISEYYGGNKGYLSVKDGFVERNFVEPNVIQESQSTVIADIGTKAETPRIISTAELLQTRVTVVHFPLLSGDVVYENGVYVLRNAVYDLNNPIILELDDFELARFFLDEQWKSDLLKINNPNQQLVEGLAKISVDRNGEIFLIDQNPVYIRTTTRPMIHLQYPVNSFEMAQMLQASEAYKKLPISPYASQLGTHHTHVIYPEYFSESDVVGLNPYIGTFTGGPWTTKGFLSVTSYQTGKSSIIIQNPNTYPQFYQAKAAGYLQIIATSESEAAIQYISSDQLQERITAAVKELEAKGKVVRDASQAEILSTADKVAAVQSEEIKVLESTILPPESQIETLAISPQSKVPELTASTEQMIAEKTSLEKTTVQALPEGLASQEIISGKGEAFTVQISDKNIEAIAGKKLAFSLENGQMVEISRDIDPMFFDVNVFDSGNMLLTGDKISVPLLGETKTFEVNFILEATPIIRSVSLSDSLALTSKLSSEMNLPVLIQMGTTPTGTSGIITIGGQVSNMFTSVSETVVAAGVSWSDLVNKILNAMENGIEKHFTLGAEVIMVNGPGEIFYTANWNNIGQVSAKLSKSEFIQAAAGENFRAIHDLDKSVCEGTFRNLNNNDIKIISEKTIGKFNVKPASAQTTPATYSLTTSQKIDYYMNTYSPTILTAIVFATTAYQVQALGWTPSTKTSAVLTTGIAIPVGAVFQMAKLGMLPQAIGAVSLSAALTGVGIIATIAAIVGGEASNVYFTRQDVAQFTGETPKGTVPEQMIEDFIDDIYGNDLSSSAGREIFKQEYDKYTAEAKEQFALEAARVLGNDLAGLETAGKTLARETELAFFETKELAGYSFSRDLISGNLVGTQTTGDTTLQVTFDNNGNLLAMYETKQTPVSGPRLTEAQPGDIPEQQYGYEVTYSLDLRGWLESAFNQANANARDIVYRTEVSTPEGNKMIGDMINSLTFSTDPNEIKLVTDMLVTAYKDSGHSVSGTSIAQEIYSRQETRIEGLTQIIHDITSSLPEGETDPSLVALHEELAGLLAARRTLLDVAEKEKTSVEQKVQTTPSFTYEGTTYELVPGTNTFRGHTTDQSGNPITIDLKMSSDRKSIVERSMSYADGSRIVITGSEDSKEGQTVSYYDSNKFTKSENRRTENRGGVDHAIFEIRNEKNEVVYNSDTYKKTESQTVAGVTTSYVYTNKDIYENGKLTQKETTFTYSDGAMYTVVEDGTGNRIAQRISTPGPDAKFTTDKKTGEKTLTSGSMTVSLYDADGSQVGTQQVTKDSKTGATSAVSFDNNGQMTEKRVTTPSASGTTTEVFDPKDKKIATITVDSANNQKVAYEPGTKVESWGGASRDTKSVETKADGTVVSITEVTHTFESGRPTEKDTDVRTTAAPGKDLGITFEVSGPFAGLGTNIATATEITIQYDANGNIIGATATAPGYGTTQLSAEEAQKIADKLKSKETPPPAEEEEEEGPSCFLSETKILMADSSYKNIEDVKEGDYVASYDFETKGLVGSLVKKKFVHDYDGEYLIINGRLKVTPNHPLFVDEQWKKAGEVKVGDKLFGKDGDEVEVVSVRTERGKLKVYNLEISGVNNYFAENVLVHNKDTGEEEGPPAEEEGPPCFLSGTKILIYGGSYKNIEDVKEGDYVVSFNLKTGRIVDGLVKKKFVHDYDGEYLIINGKIKVTPNHPLFVNEKWVEAGKIKVGDKLLYKNGSEVNIVSITVARGKIKVYNLEVGATGNYFAEDVLVHNKDTGEEEGPPAEEEGDAGGGGGGGPGDTQVAAFVNINKQINEFFGQLYYQIVKTLQGI